MRYLELELSPPVSKIGLGTWQFGSWEWGYGEGYAHRVAGEIVARALELGITLFDTAEIYGLGRSERILGNALAGHRDRVFVATKLFPLLPTPRVVVRHGAASARRLGVEWIDLYQVHQPNPVVSDSTTMRGMRVLRDRGLVREVGVSNYSLGRWRKAEAAYGERVLSNQVSYSLVDRRPERELISFASANQRLVIAYSPLARGFLGGNYGADHRPSNRLRRFSRNFRAESFARAAPLFDALREIARGHDATPAQVALAWTIREPNVVAIAGASTVAQVEANAEAAELDLEPDEIEALNRTSAAFGRG